MPIHIPVQYADTPQIVDVRVKTNPKKILERVVQKAIDGGWKHFSMDRWKVVEHLTGLGILGEYSVDNLDKAQIDKDHIFFHINTIVFDHDFAKALWGDEDITVPISSLNDRFYYQQDIGDRGVGGDLEAPADLFHLQQMVIADDLINYLELNS